MEKPKYFVTTPIYYVNDIPHIGHMYTTLSADMIARFMRLDGYDVKFITGTDEHGQKVEKAALTAGKSPQDFVDSVSQNFRDLTTQMKFSNDDFLRTTEPRHIKTVQHIWSVLLEKGDIYLGSYEGWYAVRDEAFYQESEIVDGKAPTGAPVEWVVEPSYFFRLSKWQEPLLAYYRDHPDFIAPDSRRNEVMRFVEGGLHDLSVSRTSFKWGVPVPNDPDHIIYVWLDALTFYMTALGYPDHLAENQGYWDTCLHILGKDILRFHAVYWPAFLMAAGLTPPKRVFAHGWWTIEGEKMSKSLGNVIDPVAVSQTFGRDALKYFLLREVPFGNDGDYSEANLISRLNSDLANSYGNLVQRVLSFIAKTCEGIVPTPDDLTSADETLLKQGEDLLPLLRQEIQVQALHKVCEHIWCLIAEANRYVDEQKPWSLKTENPKRMATILYVLADAIRQIALLTQPIIPEASARILDQLAIPEGERGFANLGTRLVSGGALPAPEGVFPRYVG